MFWSGLSAEISFSTCRWRCISVQIISAEGLQRIVSAAWAVVPLRIEGWPHKSCRNYLIGRSPAQGSGHFSSDHIAFCSLRRPVEGLTGTIRVASVHPRENIESVADAVSHPRRQVYAKLRQSVALETSHQARIYSARLGIQDVPLSSSDPVKDAAQVKASASLLWLLSGTPPS